MAPAKKLLDQVREIIRRKHYARSTEKTYVLWIKRFILFHQKQHPQGEADRRNAGQSAGGDAARGETIEPKGAGSGW